MRRLPAGAAPVWVGIMLGVLLTLVAALAAGAGATAGAVPARCYCVPAGQCGGYIRDWQRQEPVRCANGGGECCDLDNLPVAEVAQPGRKRSPPAFQPELNPADIEFDGFSVVPWFPEDPNPLPRPELVQDFDIPLPADV